MEQGGALTTPLLNKIIENVNAKVGSWNPGVYNIPPLTITKLRTWLHTHNYKFAEFKTGGKRKRGVGEDEEDEDDENGDGLGENENGLGQGPDAMTPATNPHGVSPAVTQVGGFSPIPFTGVGMAAAAGPLGVPLGMAAAAALNPPGVEEGEEDAELVALAEEGNTVPDNE